MNPKKILTPTLFWICLALMILLRLALPVAFLVSSPSNLVGLVPIGAGFLVLAAAWRLFWRAQTNLNPFNPPDRFIQVGPYRFSRNPMYLGMALILTGTWLLLGALSPLALVAGFILLTERWYIAFEEREMLAKYGPEYAAYQTRTRRWI